MTLAQWHWDGDISTLTYKNTAASGNNYSNGKDKDLGEEEHCELNLVNHPDFICGICLSDIPIGNWVWITGYHYFCNKCAEKIKKAPLATPASSINSWKRTMQILASKPIQPPKKQLVISKGNTHRCSQCTLLRCSKPEAWCEECAQYYGIVVI